MSTPSVPDDYIISLHWTSASTVKKVIEALRRCGSNAVFSFEKDSLHIHQSYPAYPGTSLEITIDGGRLLAYDNLSNRTLSVEVDPNTFAKQISGQKKTDTFFCYGKLADNLKILHGNYQTDDRPRECSPTSFISWDQCSNVSHDDQTEGRHDNLRFSASHVRTKLAEIPKDTDSILLQPYSDYLKLILVSNAYNPTKFVYFGTPTDESVPYFAEPPNESDKRTCNYVNKNELLQDVPCQHDHIRIMYGALAPLAEMVKLADANSVVKITFSDNCYGVIHIKGFYGETGEACWSVRMSVDKASSR